MRFDPEAAKVYFFALENSATEEVLRLLRYRCSGPKLERRLLRTAFVVQNSLPIVPTLAPSSTAESGRYICRLAETPPNCVLFDEKGHWSLERAIVHKLAFLVATPAAPQLQLRLGVVSFSEVPMKELSQSSAQCVGMRESPVRRFFEANVPFSTDALLSQGFSVSEEFELIDIVSNSETCSTPIRARFQLLPQGTVLLRALTAKKQKHLTYDLWLPQGPCDIRLAIEAEETAEASADFVAKLTELASVAASSTVPSSLCHDVAEIVAIRHKRCSVWSKEDLQFQVSQVGAFNQAVIEVEVSRNSWQRMVAESKAKATLKASDVEAPLLDLAHSVCLTLAETFKVMQLAVK